MVVGAAAGEVLAARVLWLYRERTEPVRGLGLLSVIMLVYGPVVQPWYVLWAVLPLAASARLPKQRLRLALASTVVALALPPVGASVGVLAAGYASAAVLVATGGWWLHRRISSAPAGGYRDVVVGQRLPAETSGPSAEPTTVADHLADVCPTSADGHRRPAILARYSGQD